MRRLLLLLTLMSVPVLMGAKDFKAQRVRKDDFLGQLKRDIKKIDKSIAITKDLVGRSKGEKYLPDLHFRLAELYVAKSRLLYFKVLEEAGLEDKRSITAPESRLLKDQAIRTYRRVLTEFPEYEDNDKIRFYIAHELRELGEFDQMIKEYQLLVEQYPKSDLRVEAFLVLGDYYFDKADLDNAEKYYRNIIESPESYVHNLARYKLAWCYINKERFKEAMALFEKVITTEEARAERVVQVDSQSRMNVKREALVDSAYCYTEVKKPNEAVAYYRKLASSRQDYLAALEKLARRYSIKGNPAAAASLYREAMGVSNDVEKNMELAFKIYEMVQQSKKREDTERDVELLVNAAARFRFSWRVTEDEKQKTLADVELIARDLATKLQTEAQQKDKPALHAKAARAYKAYLSLFADGPAAADMTWNFAEALFESQQFVEAGQVYEKLVRLNPGAAPAVAEKKEAATPAKKPAPPAGKGAPAVPPKVPAGAAAPAKDPAAKGGANAQEAAKEVVAAATQDNGERKKAMYSAVISYFEALKNAPKLTRVDQTLAREGIKNLGAQFVEEFPKDEYAPQVKFNVARAYYETGELTKAFDLFFAFANEYPTNKDAQPAANLALDCLSQKEDYLELAKRARELAKVERLGDDGFKKELVAMAGAADQQEIDRRTIESQGNLKEALKDIIREKKGTDVAAKALYQAFAVAKDRRDNASMEQVGQEIMTEYPDSTYTQAVLPVLGEMAIQAGEFEKGAAHYEDFARRFAGKDKAANDLLAAAAELRMALGDRASGMANFEKLYREGDSDKRAGYAMRVARAAMETRNWRRAADAAQPVFDDKDNGVAARLLAGEANLRAGDEGGAARLLQETVNTGSRGDGDARAYAAKASFLLGELVRKEFEPIQFGNGADDNAVLEGKFGRLQQMDELYGQAVQLGDAESAIAALYRLGQVYKETAGMLDNAPMPAGLGEGDQAAYKAALAERSGPMKQQSDEYLKACKQKAVELRIFSPYTRACLLGGAVGDETTSPPARAAVEIPGADELRNKLRANPKDMASLLELAKRALAVNDMYAAGVLFNRAEEINENSAEVLNGLGVTAYATGRPQDAYFYFQKATKADEGYGPAHLNLSLLFAEYGDTKAAAQEKGRAGSASANSPEIIRPVGAP